MKRFLSILLCFAILAEGEDYARGQMAGGILIVFCAAAAGVLIFWCHHTVEAPQKRCLVLQKSTDGRASWCSLATNVMVVPRDQISKAFPAFGVDMTDEAAFFRIVEIPMPPGYQVRNRPGSGVTAFVY